MIVRLEDICEKHEPKHADIYEAALRALLVFCRSFSESQPYVARKENP